MYDQAVVNMLTVSQLKKKKKVHRQGSQMFDMTNVNAFSSAEQMKGGCLLKISNLEKYCILHFYIGTTV